MGHVYVSLTNGSRECIGPSRCKRRACKRWVCPFLNLGGGLCYGLQIVTVIG